MRPDCGARGGWLASSTFRYPLIISALATAIAYAPIGEAVQRRKSFWDALTPPQLFAGSFLALVALGTLGLKVLPGLYTGEPLSWLDALFTATSAICVTGLIVVDTATYFTMAGQAYILLMIQLGGLGIITFTSLIILALGQRLSLRQETLVSQSAGPVPTIDFQRLTRDVVLFTLAIEAAGFLLLFILWIPDFGLSGAAWNALFHSISAFCNAGFSTFTNSLIGFQEEPFVLGVIMALIVLGGIGFLTLEELYMWRRAREAREAEGRLRRFSLSVHSRLVLITTTILIVSGWVLFTAFEWGVTLTDLSVLEKLVNGLFLSVTPRTAGFNTIDYAEATGSTNFLTILFMSIGGSPGSTAGGLKTTTFALIGLLALARLRGDVLVNIWSRSVPEETVQRAVGLFVLGFGLVTVCIFVFTATEIDYRPASEIEAGFLTYMFEAVSAFNTVGLSMGVTGTLSVPGKLTAILLMFIGRVGPLTFAAAVARQRRISRRKFRYAYEDVIIG